MDQIISGNITLATGAGGSGGRGGDVGSHNSLSVNFNYGETADKRQVILKWLDPPDPSRNFNEAYEKHTDDTGTWLLTCPEYVRWLSNGGFVWLHGKAGCGKTILSSIVVSDVMDRCTNSSGSASAYFYFDGRDSQTALQLFKSLLLSLVAQLISQLSTLPNSLAQLYGTGLHTPSLTDVERLFLELIGQFSDVYIIIDSLDECGERARVIKWIVKVVTSSHPTLHLLATSRPEPEIQRSILALNSSVVALAVDSEGISDDMDRHIDEMLASRWTKLGRAEVNGALLGDGGGVFRLLDFQLKALQKCANLREVKRKLQTLPKTLQDMYDNILLNLGEGRTHALELLTWLAFSFEPLKLEDITEIGIVILNEVADDGLQSFDEDGQLLEDFILGDCSDLITMHKGYVKLVHLSIKEHVFSSSSVSTFKISELNAHLIISQSYLVYITYYAEAEANNDIMGMGGGEGANDRDRFPLLSYAVSRWVDHVDSAGGDHSSGLQQLLRAFFGAENPAFLKWRTLYTPDPASPLYYACQLGLLNLVRYLLESNFDVNALEEDGHLLQAAAYGGHLEILRLLLEKGADVNAKSKFSGDALQAAAYQGRTEAVRILLENGANANAPGGEYGTALEVASYEGNVEIVLMLLREGADVNGQGGFFGNALQVAARRGHTDIVHVLLENGADVSVRGQIYDNALDLARRHNNIEVVSLLKAYGAVTTD